MTRSQKKLNKNRKYVRFHRDWKQLYKRRQEKIQNQFQSCHLSEEIDLEIFNDSNENDNPVNFSLEDQLKSWAIENAVSMRGLDSLLKVLISAGHKTLPKSYRTLLQTPRTVELSTFGNAKFWYRGLAECLNITFSKLDKDLKIELKFNVDGIPIFKSSPIQFWPILASVHREYFCLSCGLQEKIKLFNKNDYNQLEN